jgi:hypothetical protein
LLRWILTGARAPSGELVKLEGMRIGGRWMTSKEALQRFGERLTPRLEHLDNSTRPRTPLRREQASKRAERLLEKTGI